MRLWVRWSAWLCVSLMFWAATAESTHNHPNQTESASCSICIVAHSASPIRRQIRDGLLIGVLSRYSCIRPGNGAGNCINLHRAAGC